MREIDRCSRFTARTTARSLGPAAAFLPLLPLRPRLRSSQSPPPHPPTLGQAIHRHHRRHRSHRAFALAWLWCRRVWRRPVAPHSGVVLAAWRVRPSTSPSQPSCCSVPASIACAGDEPEARRRARVHRPRLVRRLGTRPRVSDAVPRGERHTHMRMHMHTDVYMCV